MNTIYRLFIRTNYIQVPICLFLIVFTNGMTILKNKRNKKCIFIGWRNGICCRIQFKFEKYFVKMLTYKGKNAPWEIIWTHCDLVFHQENLCRWKYGLSRQALKFFGLFFQIRQEKMPCFCIFLHYRNQVFESPWHWIVIDLQGFS